MEWATQTGAVFARAYPALDSKWLILGAAVAIVSWLALVPFVFLLWQSFMTPSTADMPELSRFGACLTPPDARPYRRAPEVWRMGRRSPYIWRTGA